MGHHPVGILGKEELLSQLCDINIFNLTLFARLRIEAVPKLLSLLDT